MKKRTITLNSLLRCFTLLLVVQLWSIATQAQVVWNPSPASSTIYMSASNWTGGSIPGTSSWAQISGGTSNVIFITMNSSNNNGTANQAVGAIEVPSSRSIATTFGASSAIGVLTLNGTTVSGTSNVILSNSSSSALGFTVGSPVLRVAIPGSSNRNIVTAGGSSSTTIGSTINITDTATSSAPLTFLAGGTWDGSTGNAGGLLKFSNTQSLTGGITVGKSDGTQNGILEYDAILSLSNTTGNNITIYPYSELFVNSTAGTYTTDNITLNLYGYGNNASTTTTGGALVTKSSTSYTWTGNINLASDAAISTLGTQTLTVSGNITGSGMLVKTGNTAGGVLLLTGSSNSWSGGTQIGAGTINVSSSSSMPSGAVSMTGLFTSVNSTLSLNNTAQTITSLSSSFVPTSGTQTQTLSLASGHTLTINQSTNTSFGCTGSVTTQNSVITGAGAVVKTGSGILTLSSSGNSFTGGLTLSGGEIRFNPATNTNVNLGSCPVTMNGGSLTTTSTSSTATITFNTLNLADNSTIDLGTGTSHSIKFANSSAVSWTASKKLNITNWQGAFNGTAGTKGRVFIGTTSAGVTSGQLAQIQFTDAIGNYYPAIILSTGEIVPTATITTTAAGFGPFNNSVSNAISVAFTTNGPFTSLFKVQLSDASGTFTADTTTGIIGSGSTSPISATIAAGTAPGASYRVRVINGTPHIVYGNDNGSNIVLLVNSPTITSVTADYGIPGSSVTIAGTNFSAVTAYDVVYFGATRATVTAASTTSITATIPAGATYGPVSVVNLGLNLSAYQPYSFLPIYNTTSLTAGEINFNTALNLSVGSAPFTGIIGDLDGDGKPDLITANSGASTLSVDRNTSAAGSLTSSSFTASTALSTASGPTNVHLADVDGDGKPDIIVVEAGATAVGIFRNTSTSGSISFATRVDVSTSVSGLIPIEVTVADYDGDGRPDLAVSSSYSGNIVVLQNASSSGTVSFNAAVAFTSGSGSFGITSADFDGDGKMDIAVVDTGSASVAVFRNTASAGTINSSSFASAVNFATGSTPIDVEAADIDGDGQMDIITSNLGSNTISILHNTASAGSITSGSFASHVDFASGTNPSGLGIGDIDGDGKVDIAVSNSNSNSISVYRNTSTSGSISSGSLATKVDFSTSGTGPEGMSIGDLDLDGKPDIVVACESSNGLSVFRNLRFPVVAAISGSTTVCVGSGATYTDATAGGTWGVTDGSIAAITTGGVLSATGAGNDTVTYRLVVSGDTTIVSYPIIITAGAYAGTISGASSVCYGATVNLSISGTGGSWSSSNAAVASVSGSGVVYGVTAGSAVISYIVTTSCGNDTATHSITVNPLPDAGTVSGASSLCQDATTSFTTTGTGGSWTSSATSVATVSAGGVVLGVSAGSAIITYTVTTGCGTNYSTGSISIVALPDAGTITGVDTICAGATSTFTASGTGGTWSSRDTTVATVNTSGLVRGIAGGADNIIYTISNMCGTDFASKAVTINPLPNAGTVSGVDNMCASGSVTYTTSGDAGGTWSSSNTTIASIYSTSNILGVSAGTVTISYSVTNSCGTSYATKSLTVLALPVAGTITGPTSVEAGTSITLADATSGGTWSSSNTSLATVNSAGVVRGVAVGTLNISYAVTNSCGIAYATYALNVTTDYAPYFTAGTTQSLAVCSNFIRSAINANLRALDLDAGQTLTWSLATAPAHGTAVVDYTAVSAGVAITPTLLSYTPTAGYSGSDSFVVRISDGTTSTTTKFNVTIRPIPAAPVITSSASAVCVGSSVTLTGTPSGGTWYRGTVNVTYTSDGVVTGVSAGTATMNYKIAGYGCSNSTNFYLPVDAPGVVNAITGSGIVCTGAAITLSDYSGGGTWSSSNSSIATVSGSGVVSGVTGGSVTISYTYTSGCGVVTPVRTIAVQGVPSTGTLAGPTTVAVGGVTHLVSSTLGGTWSSASTAVATVTSAGYITGVTAGTVNISYTVSNSCYTNSTYRTVSVTGSRADNQPVVVATEAADGIKVYPNPTNGMVTVALTGNTLSTTAILTDMRGKVIDSKTTDEKSIQFDMSGLAAGIYILNVSADGKLYTEKIVVE